MHCGAFVTMKLSCALLLAVLGTALAYKSYSGYQVLQTTPLTSDVLPMVARMQSDPRFNFWQSPRVGREVLIMAAPEDVSNVRDFLQQLGLAPSTYIDDVGVTVESERAEIEAIKSKEDARSARAADFTRYYNVDEIMAYIHEIADANPSIATIVNVATSTEGRGVHALKISSGSGKKAIWIDCLTHAREWLSGSVCIKSIEEVIASSSLQNLADWYILPVANPDGYAFSWSDQRLWRKTRRPNAGSSCVGTDPNRNYDFLWNENNNNNFCAEDYPGNRAFSEPECAGIGSLVNSLGQSNTLAIYFAIHSYGALMLYPYGHTNVPVPNQPELQAAGDEAAAIINSFRGTVYDVGASGESLYYTWGASDDYAYGVGGVPYSYTFELPGGGSAGFNPPPSAILPCVEETWPGIESLARRAIANAK